MCGILGVAGSDLPSPENIANKLSHRGPDDTGIYQDQKIMLIHSLLATRAKLENSKQPVMTESKRWVFAFNGEIYNTDSLITAFHLNVADKRSDTQVLAELIDKVGTEFAKHIDGMYAVALFDREASNLHLFRDSAGQKCLYYCVHKKELYFSSEIGALLSLSKRLDKTVNTCSLTLAGHIGYFPTQKTIFANVLKLMPGEHLCFSIDFGTYKNRTVPHLAKASSENFSSKIKSLAPSSSEVAINLSGGLDSTIVLHELSTVLPKIRTYTTKYIDSPAAANSEAQFAKRLSKIYGTEHTEFEYSAKDYADDFIEAYKCLDEPNYNSSVPLYFSLAKFQGINGRGERVVFTGDGGDEIGFGYSHYHKSQNVDNLLRFFPPQLLNFGYLALRNKKVNFGDSIHRWLHYKSWQPAFHKKQNSLHRNAELINNNFEEINFTRIVNEDHNCHSTMKLDRLFWLANEAFIRSDKLYMSQSVEVRFPLALPSLIQFSDEEIANAKSAKSLLGKASLRQRYKNKIPEFILDRKEKVGWTPPVELWYSKNGLRERIMDILPDYNSELVLWKKLKQNLATTETWPGKTFYWYISLALIKSKYNLSI